MVVCDGGEEVSVSGVSTVYCQTAMLATSIDGEGGHVKQDAGLFQVVFVRRAQDDVA